MNVVQHVRQRNSCDRLSQSLMFCTRAERWAGVEGVDKESLQCLLFLHDDLRLDSVKELQGGDLL